jgi:hypothetical protein
MASCEVVRNTNLDLTLSGELRRPETGCVFGAFDDEEVNHYFAGNLYARKSFPHLWLAARYECTEWFSTNGIQIPKTTELLRYWYDKRTPLTNPVIRAHVKALSINVHQGLEQLLPAPTLMTYVKDYRYRRADHTFASPCIDYELSPGAAWKSGNDKELNREADKRFKMARMISPGFAPARYSVWLVLALILLPFGIFLLLKRKLKIQSKTTK